MNMDIISVRLECLNMAQSINVTGCIERAQIYYDWVVGFEEKPKRGRPPKEQSKNIVKIKD